MTIFDTIARAVRERGGDPEISQHIEARLRAEFGTSKQYIPAPDKRARNEAIRREAAAGRSHSEIARKFGMHRSSIGWILRHPRGFGSEDWQL